VRLPKRLSAPAFRHALDCLSEGTAPVGLVYGSLLESRPDLLDAAAAAHAVLGNSADTVRRLKDPFAFAALCQNCAVPHPEVATAPGVGEWLEKRAGGVGGGHVRPARPGWVRPPRYVQRQVPGEPVSALFLADGRRALVLGFSAQWAAPAPGQPFRWGGATRPAALAPALAAAMRAAVGRVAAAASLVGLNGADFLVREDGFDLLETNPRPGASLDVFESGAPKRRALFHLHVDACRGQLPTRPPRFPGAAASAVAYACRTMALPVGFAWPDWTADRQRAGRLVTENEPLCTVLAEADNAEAARALATERVGIILEKAEDA